MTSFRIYVEVFAPEGIFPVSPALRFLIVHGELHVLLHPVLLTVKVIVARSATGVCYGIFRVEAVQAVEFFHQWNKAFHVRPVVVDVCHGNIRIGHTDQDVVNGQ